MQLNCWQLCLTVFGHLQEKLVHWDVWSERITTVCGRSPLFSTCYWFDEFFSPFSFPILLPARRSSLKAWCPSNYKAFALHVFHPGLHHLDPIMVAQNLRNKLLKTMDKQFRHQFHCLYGCPNRHHPTKSNTWISTPRTNYPSNIHNKSSMRSSFYYFCVCR